MAQPVPPLSTLRSFERVAYRLSFTEAAAELHVTQTAVSHQIRLLEDYLGTRVFDRSRRRIALTDAGQILLPAVTRAIDDPTRAVLDIQRSKGRLVVSTTPCFGARWLAPRLARFMQGQPAMELTIHHTTSLVDLEKQHVDVAIRWGGGSWPSGSGELLVDAPLAPLCSAAYAARLELDGIDGIGQATILLDGSIGRERLRDAGLDLKQAKSVIMFDDENAMIQAIIDGSGIGFAPLCLLEEHIRRRDIVMPFGAAIVQPGGYHVLVNRASAGQDNIRQFRDFLRSEFSAGPA